MRPFVLVALIILATAQAQAQKSGRPPAPEKVLQETGRALRQAQSTATTEAARQAADLAADRGQLNQLAIEAQAKLSKSPGEGDQALIKAVDKRLEAALGSAAPEGRAIITQSAAAPAMRAPDPDASQEGAAQKSRSATAGASGKKGNAPETPPKDIDIRSEGAVYLDSAQALAIFTDDVVVDHPQFHMTSDKLEVYFVKQSKATPPPDKTTPDKTAKGGKTAAPGAPPKATPVDPPAPESGDTQLKQAIATGRKVVVNKLDENGEPQIGICRHLTYIGESGDVILREMPQVQRGGNVIIARDPSTYMVMKQNGELKVHGPADTKIQQKPDAGGKPKAPALAPAGAVPGTPTLTPKKTAKE